MYNSTRKFTRKPGRRSDGRPGRAKSLMPPRKRYCRFCVDKINTIDYKDKVLERLISDRGKILSRRQTGTCAKHQRLVSSAVKRARFIAILPYTKL